MVPYIIIALIYSLFAIPVISSKRFARSEQKRVRVLSIIALLAFPISAVVAFLPEIGFPPGIRKSALTAITFSFFALIVGAAILVSFLITAGVLSFRSKTNSVSSTKNLKKFTLYSTIAYIVFLLLSRLTELGNPGIIEPVGFFIGIVLVCLIIATVAVTLAENSGKNKRKSINSTPSSDTLDGTTPNTKEKPNPDILPEEQRNYTNPFRTSTQQEDHLPKKHPKS